MEMAVKSMETALEAMESMEMAPGALPRPGKVQEQRHQNWSSTAATLWNFSGKNAERFKVSASEGLK
jgi:hypothetical protein